MYNIYLGSKAYFIFRVMMFVVFISSICFLPLKYKSDKKEAINCHVDLTIHRVELGLIAKMIIEFSMNDQNGIVYIDGVIYKNNERIGSISRRTFFEMIFVNYELLLMSKKSWVTEINNIDESLFSDLMLSKFYLEDNNIMAVMFTKKQKGSYYVSTKTMPHVYCANIVRDH